MLQDITPIMTGYTTPAPYVVSTSGSYSTALGWKAFSNTSQWHSYPKGICWLKFDFNIKTKIDAFSIYYESDVTTAAPKDFILYGSNDDVTYQQITNISNQIGWNKTDASKPNLYFDTRLYQLGFSVNFRYYKLEISADNGYGYTFINNLRFYQEDNTDFVTNKNASMAYCLPKNSTFAMQQRINDPREGLLGFTNDPDDRYGTLYMIDNKGKAIIPKTSIVSPDILFNGVISTGTDIILTNPITKYKFISIECYGGGGFDSNVVYFPVPLIEQKIDAYISLVEQNLLITVHIARIMFDFRSSYNNQITELYFKDIDMLFAHSVRGNDIYINRCRVYGIK